MYSDYKLGPIELPSGIIINVLNEALFNIFMGSISILKTIIYPLSLATNITTVFRSAQ